MLLDTNVLVYAAADRLLRPLTADQALAWIEQLEVFPCLAIDADLVKIGAEISERYQLSYWDGTIIAAADSLDAGILYTEDLNHGQRYGGILVQNPFLPG